MDDQDMTYMKNLCEYYYLLAKKLMQDLNIKDGPIWMAEGNNEPEYYIDVGSDLCLRRKSRSRHLDKSHRFGGYGYVINGKELK